MPAEFREIIAYQIWEEQGRPHGRAVEHWQEAELRLSAPATAKMSKSATLKVKLISYKECLEVPS